MIKIYGDILQCKWCFRTYKNIYPDFQDNIRQRCPYCLHNGYWVITDKRYMKKPDIKLCRQYFDKISDNGIAFTEDDKKEYIRYILEVRRKWKKKK